MASFEAREVAEFQGRALMSFVLDATLTKKRKRRANGRTAGRPQQTFRTAGGNTLKLFSHSWPVGWRVVGLTERTDKSRRKNEQVKGRESSREGLL